MTDTHDPSAREAAPSTGDGRPRACSDGVPARMTRREARILVEERERLLARFASDDRTHRAAGGRNACALATRETFWAELVDTFTSGRLGEAIVREASPRLHDMLHAFFRRTEPPPSGAAADGHRSGTGVRFNRTSPAGRPIPRD